MCYVYQSLFCVRSASSKHHKTSRSTYETERRQKEITWVGEILSGYCDLLRPRREEKKVILGLFGCTTQRQLFGSYHGRILTCRAGLINTTDTYGIAPTTSNSFVRLSVGFSNFSFVI
jgi:hypothetical protein